MGWGKKLKKLGGKLFKAAIKVAPVVATGGIGSLGPLGAIAASKLRSVGANRTKAKLLERISAGGEGLSGATLAIKQTKGSRGLPPGVSGAMGRPLPELVAMRDPAVKQLLMDEGQKGRKALVTRQASSVRAAKARWKTLDQETKDALTQQFKTANPKGASDTAWAEYVLNNS